jgi:hypothetical protein
LSRPLQLTVVLPRFARADAPQLNTRSLGSYRVETGAHTLAKRSLGIVLLLADFKAAA